MLGLSYGELLDRLRDLDLPADSLVRIHSDGHGMGERIWAVTDVTSWALVLDAGMVLMLRIDAKWPS